MNSCEHGLRSTRDAVRGERVQMAVPAKHREQLGGLWAGEQLCHAHRVGVGQHPDGSTMGGSQGCSGFSLSHLGQEGTEGEAAPLIPPSGSG